MTTKPPEDTTETVRKYASIGYAIEFIMDYGSGRQATITATLPLDSPLSDFNRELDKLRFATNRQQAHVIMRDREARLKAEEKMAASLRHMIVEYEKGIEDEMKRLKDDPESLHKTGNIRTQVSAQVANLRTQASNWLMQQRQDILKHEGEIEVCKVIIASCKSEIASIDGV